MLLPPATDKRAFLQGCDHELACSCVAMRSGFNDKEIAISKPEVREVASNAEHDLAARNPVRRNRDLLFGGYDRKALRENAAYSDAR